MPNVSLGVLKKKVKMLYWTTQHNRRRSHRRLGWLQKRVFIPLALHSIITATLVEAGTTTSSYTQQYNSGQSFMHQQPQKQNLLNSMSSSVNGTSSEGYYVSPAASHQQAPNMLLPAAPGTPVTFEPRGDIGGGYGGGGFGASGGGYGMGGGWGGGGGGYGGEVPAVYKYQVYPVSYSYRTIGSAKPVYTNF